MLDKQSKCPYLRVKIHFFQKNNMETKAVDLLSVWIQNKQLIETINKNNVEIESLQQDIISNVFGNFHKLLQFLLNNVNNLDIEKQQLLHNTLRNHLFDKNDIDKNSKLLITTLPNDCLSYTMKFLEPNDRYIIEGIESNENNLNLKSLQLYANYMLNI